MKSFVGITGTTCVGKSAVAVELAKILNCEIISADSMQIYVGMDIGTAKVTQAEMDGVKHHMLDVIEPNCDFSSFEYAEMAGKIIQSLPQPPILVEQDFTSIALFTHQSLVVATKLADLNYNKCLRKMVWNTWWTICASLTKKLATLLTSKTL